ncbi:hypothetical protein ABMA27_012848 [Loxostege sticticalis]|uniref:4Fe-4S ferredoxin-type domain-containing protein n=1 Tax=Loxostege sticticalis TaxID=481309 RepID=A0ABR3H026_LOXSC
MVCRCGGCESHCPSSTIANVFLDEIATEIGRNYRTLPIFEKGMHEYTYTKHYSLKNNEYLKCHWEKLKRNIEGRVYAPFQFLDIRDYHFYNCRTRLIPALSIHTKTDFRRKLKPGPGVDHIGQMPIPQELHLKRGEKKIKRPMSKKGKEDEKRQTEDKKAKE